ncbi:MAG: RNA polymerase sigma factor [Gammaproteobacteria bacterium]|nr:RNA polymerase sigma factor [Gammaproteobacteria bacterium]NNJ71974.1 RNA polymerase sigma factor [Enterobacterales bacterium]
MTFSAKLNNADEVDIVTRAQKGDVSAFETLYRQHLPMIYSLCYRMVVNRSLAEELTQEAFIRVWHKLDLFQGQSKFSTWLYQLAKNVVLSSLRKKQVIDWQADHTKVLDKTSERGTDVAKIHDLENAILTLPNGARQVFVLHDVEGHKHKEISDFLGIAEGTSKTQLHRARKLLKELLL